MRRGDIGGSVTVDLAGDTPAPVTGVLLNPYGQTLSPDTLRMVEEDLANASGPRVVVLVTNAAELGAAVVDIEFRPVSLS